MKIEIRRSFEKDAAKLSATYQLQLAGIIEKIITTEKLSEISSCKKLTGFKNAFRIRMGNYRVGLFYENGTAELVRF